VTRIRVGRGDTRGDVMAIMTEGFLRRVGGPAVSTP